jgi:hypothetical protein
MMRTKSTSAPMRKVAVRAVAAPVVDYAIT